MTGRKRPQRAASGGHAKVRVPARPPAGRDGAPGSGAVVTWESVLQAGLRLPAVEEGVSYGTPALRVRGKLFVRLKEDGETIVLRTDLAERDHLIAAAPGLFFLTDHYRDYPWVLVRLSAVDPADLETLLSDAWRRVAPKTLVRARDTGATEPQKKRARR
jgi:hypothetical protein